VERQCVVDTDFSLILLRNQLQRRLDKSVRLRNEVGEWEVWWSSFGRRQFVGGSVWPAQTCHGSLAENQYWPREGAASWLMLHIDFRIF
jgi:hypothetical protein